MNNNISIYDLLSTKNKNVYEIVRTIADKLKV